MKLRFILLVSLMMIFLFSPFLFAQPLKKNVHILPEIIKTTSESDLVLLDSVFQIIVSPVNRYPLITTITHENDSVRVILTDENGELNYLILKSLESKEVPYSWMFAATGTLALLILLYFVRF